MKNYYTYDENSKHLNPVSRVVVVDGQTKVLGPPEDFASILSAYPMGPSTAPVPPEGKQAVQDGFQLSSNQWVPAWTYVDIPGPTVDDYDAAMEKHLLDERTERGYTTREPDMYVNSSVPRWASDAHDWSEHRDEVMLYALRIMNEVKAGGTPPTLEEFVAGLPNIQWTATDDEPQDESESEEPEMDGEQV